MCLKLGGLAQGCPGCEIEAEKASPIDKEDMPAPDERSRKLMERLFGKADANGIIWAPGKMNLGEF